MLNFITKRKILEYSLILLTYLIFLLFILCIEQVKHFTQESYIDYFLYFLFYFSLFLTVVSHFKTIITNPGYLNKHNEQKMIDFYLTSHFNSINRGAQLTALNEKFFMPDIDKAINEENEKEYLSDDSDITDDSKEYERGDKLEDSFFKDLSVKNSTNFKIVKVCKFCHVSRVPFSGHCSSCKSCIINYDHHCPWVSNCIGIFNHKYFLLLLGYSIVFYITSLILIVKSLIENSPNLFKEEQTSYFIYCMITSIVALIAIALLIKLIWDQHSTFYSGFNRKYKYLFY